LEQLLGCLERCSRCLCGFFKCRLLVGFLESLLLSNSSPLFLCNKTRARPRPFSNRFLSKDERFIRIHLRSESPELIPKILNRNNLIHLVEQTLNFADGLSNGLLA
jgi:hypothetical protein